ncbi:hypothetical protein D3C78_1673690 [compost metagenome]
MQCLRPTFDVSTDTAGGVPDVIQRAQRGQFPSRQDIVHFFVFTEVRVPRLSVENLARNAGTDLDGTARLFSSECHGRTQRNNNHGSCEGDFLEHAYVPVIKRMVSQKS